MSGVKPQEPRELDLSQCNCMVRYGTGTLRPARRMGKKHVIFVDPSGVVIADPDECIMMDVQQIVDQLRKDGAPTVARLVVP